MEHHPLLGFYRTPRREYAFRLVAMAPLVSHGVRDLRVLGVIRHFESYDLRVGDLPLGPLMGSTFDEDGDGLLLVSHDLRPLSRWVGFDLYGCSRPVTHGRLKATLRVVY